MDLAHAARVVGLEPGVEGAFEGITTDSRSVREGMLFAALRGANADGHEFAAQAAAAGAAALLVERPLVTKLPQLVVEDVSMALGRLASDWRDTLNPTVIGITGSNGKTTTKEMVAGILEMDSEVLATQGNYNNELGLPLTLFELNERHHFAVLEMGAGKPGDIRYLAGIAKPDVGVVTNAGPAHLQGFGNEEGVARAKGELFSSLPTEGFAVINSDQRWEDLWRSLAGDRKVLTFGLGSKCQVRLVNDSAGPRVVTPAGSFDLHLHLPGEHNLKNALAATAVTLALGIPLEQIRSGLEATRPVPGRLNLIHTVAGWTVMDDTYNANPASLYAALQVLTSDYDEPWLVLGDMKELGATSHKLHAEMGEAARSLGVNRLYALGELSEATVKAFGPGARHFQDEQSLIKALRNELRPAVACLIKGSRSMAMERVVAAITDSGEMREAG
jgi:UDP-N-acetylmuramoyl-tripeptide--D-alanyl-D-alanine ligase